MERTKKEHIRGNKIYLNKFKTILMEIIWNIPRPQWD